MEGTDALARSSGGPSADGPPPGAADLLAVLAAMPANILLLALRAA